MSAPLRVLLIGKDATLGDAGPGVAGDARARHLAYAHALRARRPGSEIRCVYYRPAARGGGDEAPAEGLRLYPTRSRHRATFLADLPRALRRALAGGWRPQLVSVQTPWEEGVAGWALARALGARFVPQLHFDLFSPAWRGEHPLNRWRRWVAGRVLRGGDVVRVVSAWLGEAVARELRIPAERVCVVPVGVRFTPDAEAREAHRAALGAGPGDRVVLFVGRFHAAKNLPLWIDAAARVAAEVPEARFVLAGDGPEAGEVRARAAARGIAERVAFPGAVGHERLPALYAAADLFVLSSDHEGFGRVIVEAGLAGVPTVGTDCSGPRELLAGGGGVLVPRGDAAGLAAAVTGLLRDDAACRALGEAARARMQAAFSADALTARLLDCWEAALAGARG
ncbi:MAG: glycosyltransferase family 4 protein [Longimicrobiaceae bacterium]